MSNKRVKIHKVCKKKSKLIAIHFHIHLLIPHPIQNEGAEGETGPEETQRNTDKTEKEELTASTNPVDQLDFYKPDPFVHCQSEGTSQVYGSAAH